jgi:hypothetical protein
VPHSIPRYVATVGLVTAAVAMGGYALASSSRPAASSSPTFECIKVGSPGTHYIEHSPNAPVVCKGGYVLVGIGATGPQGPAGPATFSVTGTTAITGRDDSGNGTGNCTASANTDCWAADSFSRVMTVTRNGAVPAGDCGSAAVRCWLYTATLADSGSFATVPGAQTPNQACTEPNGGPSCAGLLISGTVDGTLSGGGKMEFYADTAPTTTGVPATATKNAPTDTSDWYKLFFPAGTNFGLTGASQAPWTTWSWTYNAPNTCEQWTDSMADNAGDGTYASDGNIAGINQCGA